MCETKVTINSSKRDSTTFSLIETGVYFEFNNTVWIKVDHKKGLKLGTGMQHTFGQHQTVYVIKEIIITY